MAEKKGAPKSGGKNKTVPSTAALRQQAVRGQAGGARPAGQQQAKQAAPAGKQGKIEIMASRQFTNWLADQNASLAFTTYQVGKVFLLGLREDRKISLYERTFNRCMGLYADKDSMYLSSLYQLWQFHNVLAPGQKRDGFDRLYVPQVSYITGDIDIHDIAIDKHGRIIFVNTLFCCLSTVSHTHSFAPVWEPKHISKLAAEDRCHSNGMAMENGSPKYVTSIGLSDAADGWREHRQDGGVIIDVERQRSGALRTLHAAFAAHVSRQALCAQFRHRVFWHGRSQKRQIRADRILPRLYARPRLHQRLRRHRHVEMPRESDLLGPRSR